MSELWSLLLKAVLSLDAPFFLRFRYVSLNISIWSFFLFLFLSSLSFSSSLLSVCLSLSPLFFPICSQIRIMVNPKRKAHRVSGSWAKQAWVVGTGASTPQPTASVTSSFFPP